MSSVSFWKRILGRTGPDPAIHRQIEESQRQTKVRALTTLKDRAQTDRKVAESLREIGMEDYADTREQDAARSEKWSEEVKSGDKDISDALNDVLGVRLDSDE